MKYTLQIAGFVAMLFLAAVEFAYADAGPATAPAATSQPSLIRNGDMTAGEATPSDWALGSYRKGTLTMRRDTKVFRSAPASLLLETDGKAAGGAQQAIDPVPAGRFTVEGFSRAEGEFATAQVAIQALDGNWKQVDWKVVAAVATGKDWQPFHADVTLAGRPAHALISLVVDGQGKAWLDDVRITTGGQETLGQEPVVRKSHPPAEPLPLEVPAKDGHIRYVGRFDTSDPTGPRCAWPASSARIAFRGTDANALLSSSTNDDYWQISVDAQPPSIIHLNREKSLFRLASDLAPGPHTITLAKRTEAQVGTTQFLGFQLNGGAELLDVPPAKYRLEVIGDSISAGYGNEAASQNEHFTPATENACQAYGSLSANAFDAEYACVAWSGKCMWPNNTIPELYDRALPQDQKSKWDFTRWRPQVVVINLGTNDFAGGNPDENGWVGAYDDFVARVRTNYPDATLFCAIGPMMSDPWSHSKNALSTIRRYLGRVVDDRRAAGDSRVFVLEFPMQQMENGLGADWHPSLKTHQLMSDVLIKAIKDRLGWSVKPPRS